jgi:hypothetical protein
MSDPINCIVGQGLKVPEEEEVNTHIREVFYEKSSEGINS